MKDFLAIKNKILHLRNCGKVHCKLFARGNQDIQKSIMIFGEQVGFDMNQQLGVIDRDLAKKIMELILIQDLAYGSYIMPKEQASELASDFCKLFAKDAKFFTNGTFEEGSSTDSVRLRSWNPLIRSTFDTGAIIVDKKSVGCLWVGDED